MSITVGKFALNRIGAIWGVIEVLILLPIVLVFISATDGFLIKALMHFTGDFREVFVDMMIIKISSSAMMALGCALVGWQPIVFSEFMFESIGFCFNFRTRLL